MNKTDLVNAIFDEHDDVYKLTIQKILESAMTISINELLDGNTVSINGFGTLKLRKRKQRPGRTIRGETVCIPERYVPVFYPSKTLVAKIAEEMSDGEV